MKILILTNNAIGLHRFRKELIERLLADGHDVIISLPHRDIVAYFVERGCRFIQTEFAGRGMNPFAELGLLMRYIKMIRVEKPDIVLTYTVKPNVYGGLACRITRTPYVANVTGLGTAIENKGFLQTVALALYRLGLRNAKCVFFQNRANYQFFKSRSIVRGKTQIIPGSGVNIHEHGYVDYPSEQNGIKFLYIARIMKDKGINELLEAAKAIREDHPNCRFTLIGRCDEGYNELLKKMEEKGIIRYLGFQENVHEHIASHHCVLLPSYHEGTANVLLEAAACGRPVIASRVPGCMETFDEGITGIGCEAKNAKDLIRAIKDFIHISEDKHNEMGKAGRAKMEREYQRSIVVSHYISEIERKA